MPRSPVSLFIGFFVAVSAQSIGQEERRDSAEFRKYDFFPAISYSPETRLTLGVIGYRYLDLSKGDPTTVRSWINALAIYTTANQTIIESNWDIFTSGNRYRTRGQIQFSRFPDRNYGLGNDADALVQEYSVGPGGAEAGDLLNYKRFSIMGFLLMPAVLREIRPSFYAGVMGVAEYQWRFEELADSLDIIRGKESIMLLEDHTLGLRSGLGFNLIWDRRDNILNPLRGSFVDLSNLWFGRFTGSDYRYTAIRLDVRKYLNPVSNHTLALRAHANFRYTPDESLPLKGLSRVGGSMLVRGYFKGTYQDNHMVALETEYRLPFWKEDNLAPFHKPWKRLGLVVFASAAQVYGSSTRFGMDRFNSAVGTGLRVLFNDESKVNLRIDYAWGLSPNSAGPGKKQTGLYFFLAEAF